MINRNGNQALCALGNSSFHTLCWFSHMAPNCECSRVTKTSKIKKLNFFVVKFLHRIKKIFILLICKRVSSIQDLMRTVKTSNFKDSRSREVIDTLFDIKIFVHVKICSSLVVFDSFQNGLLLISIQHRFQSFNQKLLF